LTPGTVVRLKRDVERFPDFIARAGTTGVVVRVDPNAIAVRLFMWLRGAEEWNNEVMWYVTSPSLGDPADDLEVMP
jgi:hypothetical protein